RIDLPPNKSWDEVPGFIEVANLVYTIVEYFEFTIRLAQALPNVETVELSIGMRRIRGFVLTLDDFQRRIWNPYSASEDRLERSWNLPLVELIGRGSELSLECTVWFL